MLRSRLRDFWDTVSRRPWERGSRPRLPAAAHPLVRLAAEAIRMFLSHQRVIEPPDFLFDEMPEARMPAGAFVCLKCEGRLRGCIGTTEPVHPTVALEVIHNAIGAAVRDPRFPQLQIVELEGLDICVDVLGPSESVPDLTALDHRRYGIIVRSGERRGVLLPDIEGINSVAEQVAAALDKAGLGSEEPVEMFRFEVTRYR
jgi:AmmeMemoRadiSam system protein A